MKQREGPAPYSPWDTMVLVLRKPYRKNIAGHYYLCCIFHHERTGSLRLMVDGTYHCYGCGESGTLLKFIAVAMKQKILPNDFEYEIEQVRYVLINQNKNQLELFELHKYDWLDVSNVSDSCKIEIHTHVIGLSRWTERSFFDYKYENKIFSYDPLDLYKVEKIKRYFYRSEENIKYKEPGVQRGP